MTASENRPVYTVNEFCETYRISRTYLYALIQKGKAPRLMKVGRRTLISAEAAADWRRDMERATAEAAQ